MKFTEDDWKNGRPLHDATKNFTEKLILWNKEVLGNIKKSKERLRTRLEGVQKILVNKRLRLVKIRMQVKSAMG